ncbi:MAG: hypothetical protein AAF293_03990 [Pseudomonadota bacterium]
MYDLFEFDEKGDAEFFDHDTAVMMALQKTEKGLFDSDEVKDEDLEALYDN